MKCLDDTRPNFTALLTFTTLDNKLCLLEMRRHKHLQLYTSVSINYFSFQK